jgi:uncharacterized CHY-type Zn-finger protein
MRNEPSGETTRASAVLLGLAVVFLFVALAFARHQGATAPSRAGIPLVDPALITPSTIRTSYVQLIQMKADLSDFDCYACHEKGKPPVLRFDTNQNLIIPQEHSDIVMAHGRHNRNNNCFNCHNELDLTLLQTRDRHQVRLEDSPPLCGSCHGPTYRDWEAGAHGRIGGYWDHNRGAAKRQICVDCHNPHSPKIPPRKPLPGPHPLRSAERAALTQEH